MTVASVSYDNLRVQYHDGTAWHDLGSVQDFTIDKRTRRFAAEQDIQTDRIRIVARRESDAGGFAAVERVDIFGSGDAPKVLRQIPFNFSSEQYYSFWLTDGHADIYANGIFIVAIKLPFTEEQLQTLTYTQQLDTLLLFHKDVGVIRVFRQGRHTAWQVGDAPLFNVPLFDYDGTNAGGENNRQRVDFRDYVNGDVFNLEVAGELTGSITYNSATLAADVQTALTNLGNVSDNGVTVTSSGTAIIIEFTHENGGRVWPQIIATTITSTDGGIVVATLQQGKLGGEAVISSTRGWPRCGAFVQQRLILGGLKGRPSTFLASVVGDYFNFNAELRTADGGLDVTLDGEDVVEIRHIIGGRRTTFFCAGAEYFNNDSEFSRDSLSLIHATSLGTREGVRPLTTDTPLFLERRSGSLQGFVFSNEEGNYRPEPIDINASHLMTGPIDMARRVRRTAKEADLIVIVNATGPAAALSLLRSHDIIAFSRFTTQGDFLAVGVEDKFTVEFAVRRDGTVWIERLKDGCWLDNSITLDVDDVTAVSVSGFDGQTVAVMQDGSYIGMYDVVNGGIVFDAPLSGALEVGLVYPTQIRTLPARRRDPEGGLNKERFRITQLDVRVALSVGLEFSFDGGENFKYCVNPSPTDTNLGAPSPLFESETIEMDGAGYFDFRPDISIRRAYPGPMHIKSIDTELSG